MSARRFTAILACVPWAVLAFRPAARAIELRTDLPVLGQVREGYLTNETEAPIELFGDLGLSDLRHGTTLDTFFRLEEDFAQLDGTADFYSGVLRVPGAVPGLDFQLGRQIVSQAPGTIYDADAGQIRVDPGGPVALTVFGGQPRYFEPTFGPPAYSEDEQIFGGNLRTTRWTGGQLSLGYLQQIRDGRELRQLLTATGTRSFPHAPGLPNLYGSFSFDADHQNIDQVRAGAQAFLVPQRLMLNFESGYYKPQDNGEILIDNLNRREDPIFQLFSLSQMLQFRGGLRYNVTPTVSAFSDLSYQRYDQLANSAVNGYVWGAGLLFLPGGDGLEAVQVKYYGADSAGGNVNGVHGSYENRVYDRLMFRANADIAVYDLSSNQSGTAVASLIGVDFIILPGLVAELNFEANRNLLFPEDLRFGFFITYNARYRTEQTPAGLGVQRNPTAADQRRPWPWGLPEFGPASWNPSPGYGGNASPSNGWGLSSANAWGTSPATGRVE